MYNTHPARRLRTQIKIYFIPSLIHLKIEECNTDTRFFRTRFCTWQPQSKGNCVCKLQWIRVFHLMYYIYYSLLWYMHHSVSQFHNIMNILWKDNSIQASWFTDMHQVSYILWVVRLLHYFKDFLYYFCYVIFETKTDCFQV